jgi:hypothetical protein
LSVNTLAYRQICKTIAQDGKPYNAVSYYWGNINEVENVIIHRSDEGVPGLVCEVPVTKNLTAALRQFRAKASANKEPLRLWIDALCINQTDARERQVQIMYMKFIWINAARIWIWLGDSDEVVEGGLATLIEHTNAYTLHKATGLALPSTHLLSTTLSLDEEVLYIKQFAAVEALPYWFRGWTFQENIHAHRYICRGRLRIEVRSWRLILKVLHLYERRIVQKSLDRPFLSSILSLLSNSEKEFFLEKRRSGRYFCFFRIRRRTPCTDLGLEASRQTTFRR